MLVEPRVFGIGDRRIQPFGAIYSGRDHLLVRSELIAASKPLRQLSVAPGACVMTGLMLLSGLILRAACNNLRGVFAARAPRISVQNLLLIVQLRSAPC